MNAVELIQNIADQGIRQGIFSGCNGPYYDKETEARVYSHYLCIYSKCFKWTKNSIYLEKVKELSDKIISEELFPFRKSFYHRDKEGKDQTNGLIGQAWSIEALIEATEILAENKYLEVASSVYDNHPFDDDFSLWRIIDLKGNPLTIDPTFNHQLWFASAVAPMAEKKVKIKSSITNFLDALSINLTILRYGLIYHPIDRSLGVNKQTLKTHISNYLKKSYLHPTQIKRRFQPGEFENQLITKSFGYQHFNIYAFEKIRKYFPNHYFWNSTKYIKAVNLLNSDAFENRLVNNKYAYPYNAPGFEIPFIASKNDLIPFSTAQKYFQNQVTETFDVRKGRFNNNNPDPSTLTARIYELSNADQSFLSRLSVQC